MKTNTILAIINIKFVYVEDIKVPWAKAPLFGSSLKPWGRWGAIKTRGWCKFRWRRRGKHSSWQKDVFFFKKCKIAWSSSNSVSNQGRTAAPKSQGWLQGEARWLAAHVHISFNFSPVHHTSQRNKINLENINMQNFRLINPTCIWGKKIKRTMLLEQMGKALRGRSACFAQTLCSLCETCYSESYRFQLKYLPLMNCQQKLV